MITFLVSKYSEQLMVFNRALWEFLAWKYFSNSGTVFDSTRNGRVVQQMLIETQPLTLKFLVVKLHLFKNFP